MASSYETLSELIRIPSVSGDEQALAAHVANRCESQGHEVTQMADSVVVHIPGENSTKALVLNGHLDTVPPTDQWTQDPFALRINPDNTDQLIGLGVTDMKAGLDIMLDVGKDAKDQRPPCDVWLVFSSKEETTGDGSAVVAAWMSTEVSHRYHTIGGLILEPTNAQFVGVGHRGDTVWNVSAAGPGGHASQHFNDDPPALEKIANVISSLPAVRQRWAAQYASALLGAPSINPTVIHGGTAENVVPTEAEMLLNLRITPELLPFLSEIRAAMEAEYNVTIEQRWDPPPTLCPSDEHIYTTAQAVMPNVRFQSFPGATDQVYFHKNGIYMLIYGPGDVAQMHQPNEKISRSAIRRSRNMVDLMLKHF